MDNEQKFTPGPWRAHLSGSDGLYILPDTGDKSEDVKYIAIVNGRDLQTDQQNARLIAAAPELYEALKALLPEGWGDDATMDHMPGVKLARLALAKVSVPRATAAR